VLVSNAARRALVLAPEVRNAHHAVKSERREQTLVRAFTRRFYDALDGGDSEIIDELDSDNLEALDDDDAPDDDIEPLFEDSSPALDANARVGVAPTAAPARRPSR